MSWSSWIKSGVAAVAGTAEPEYGSEAVQSVCDRVTAETALGTYDDADYKWARPDWGSNVETQTFYITTASHVCFVQIIHSNPTGLSYTAQFTCRVFNIDDASQNAWSSATLEEFGVENEGRDFKAKGVTVKLSADLTSYHLKMNCSKDTIVDVMVTRVVDGFKIGKDGLTTYGTDPAKPWGSMRHLFWPRCEAKGVILVRGAPVTVDGGAAQFIHALQGMKPHHAARRWNFCNFQGEKLSAIMMEFTTPASYGDTVVNVGGIADAKSKSILAATANNEVKHVGSKVDTETDWPEPTQISFAWNGAEAGDEKRKVHASLQTGDNLPARRLERVDVLAEIPPWLKKIAHGVSGTKPFIYQYVERKAVLKVTLTGADGKDEVVEDEGTMYVEATFIS